MSGVLALTFWAMVIGACDSGGSAGPAGDSDAVDRDQIICDTSADCPIGKFCSPEKVCIDQYVPDGDDEAADETPPAPTRIFRVVPEAQLDFGDVQSITKPEADVAIYNDGNSVMHLYDINKLEPQVDNPFVIVDYMEASIQPGASFAFKIRMEPRGLGEAIGRIRINNDSDNAPQAELELRANVIPEQGEAEIGSDPSAELGVTFDDTALGTRMARKFLRLGNTGPESSQIVLTSAYLEGQGLAPFTVEYRQSETVIPITPDTPQIIAGGQSIPLTIFFMPNASGDYEDKVVCEFHTDSSEQTETYMVPVRATAIAGPVVMLPTVLDFGAVAVSTTAVQDVKLINNTDDATIDIRPLRLYGLTNWLSFYSFSENAGGSISLAPREYIEFQVTFKPAAVTDYSAELQVESNYQGMTFFFPIVAQGGEANQKPVARIAQTSHGADINAPLTVNVGAIQEFFGDISHDPDGNSANLEYLWSLNKPAGSTASLIPHDEAPIVSVRFDVAGNYILTLLVTDELGLQSSPKNVQVLAVAGSSIFRIEMQFTGLTGASDMDLTWILPNGTMCNESLANAAGSCLAPAGAGSLQISACGSASQCTTEIITHANAPDVGNYEVQVRFDQDCNDPAPLLPDCNLGFNREEADANLYFYVDDVLTYQITGEHFDAAGDMRAWTLRRVGGLWQPPAPK